MDFLQVKQEIPSVAPDILFSINGWPVSNSFLLSLFILFLFIGLAVFTNWSIKRGYGKFRIAVELLYENIIVFLSKLAGSKRQAKLILPLSASIFLFVLVSNLILVFPGLSSLTYNGLPIFRTPTSDFNTTFGIALSMILVINLISIRDYGILEYVGRFIQVKNVFVSFRKSFKEGVLSLVNFGIGLLDIISELAKIVSLSLRLFGNVYAGEVLVVVLLGALAYAVPALWMSLSILFGLVQAVVFSSLITAYYAQSTKPGND